MFEDKGDNQRNGKIFHTFSDLDAATANAVNEQSGHRPSTTVRNHGSTSSRVVSSMTTPKNPRPRRGFGDACGNFSIQADSPTHAEKKESNADTFAVNMGQPNW